MFARKIVRISIDEVHSVYTAGRALYGQPAFRPAWGRLGELKSFLPSTITFTFFTATLPPHIRKVVTRQLMPSKKFDDVFVTTNRPNIVYATHRMVKSFDEMQNYRCFVASPFTLATQPHILIFVDNVNLTTQISDYLLSLLPPGLPNRDRVVMHYHSKMSDDYLRLAHDEFTRSDGNCRILVTTSGQSVVRNQADGLFKILTSVQGC